ncbi:MAG: VENN motif pre-toxin domain-containing protein [Serratia rubidaea]|nr:VENN motif pre-toxin domain-containing protein [Serratia rubidaea]
MEHANQALSPIFDKEKEQNRLKEAQLIGEIGSQIGDIARSEGNIRSINAGKAELANKGIKEPGKGASKEEWADYNKLLESTDSYKAAQQQWGTGSRIQQGIQAATAAIQGLAGGNLAQAVSGAATPYLAEQIHKLAPDETSRAMAHAVVGAVVAHASGNSAAAGAAGAVSGELMAQLVMKQLYPNKLVSELTEDEKQTVSILGTLAAGLAGGLATGDTAGGVTAAQTGKNAVENNLLGKVLVEGCAIAAPCRSKVAEQLIEIGVKAGIAGVTGAVIKDVADKMTSDELDHLVTLKMMGNDEITGNYLSSLQDKYAPANTGGDQLAGTEGIGKLENPVQNGNKGTSLVTPDQSGSNSSIITISPETQPGKNDGIFINPKPVENTGTGYISESTDKNSSISAGDFFKGTTYTDKVKQQASSGDFHSFPESVDGHSDKGTISVITGGDGVERLKLEISGSYRGKDGVFEYIREPDGTINHRLFVPNR